MKGRVIALGHWRGHEAAALTEDGQLQDFITDSATPRPGTLYRAVADRPAKGQGGVFVRTPDGTGFLRQARGLSAGKPLLVQVTGVAEPGKAIPLTARILFKSRYAIVTPGAPGRNVSRAITDHDLRDRLLQMASEADLPAEAGLILRSACAGADARNVTADMDSMTGLAAQVLSDAAQGPAEKLVEGDGPHALAWRDWPDPDLLAEGPRAFVDHQVEDALETFLHPVVALPTGGSFAVEPTRALVAVDVNTGRDGSPAMGLKANVAAARDLPRQLRVRGLGGQVVLDPAPMPKKDRRAFESALRAAFRRDDVETSLVGWTPLGHYELQRKRDRAPLWSVRDQTKRKTP
ncbi:MAG: ribonuclease E/G [Pseudomonadota bacterium]